MISQKDAIVQEVKRILPNFKLYHDVALTCLSSGQLEELKNIVQQRLRDGTIAYSKDRTNFLEVRTYARSVVMNHLKKARELNGNQALATSSTKTPSSSTSTTAPNSKINWDILSQELRDFLRALE